MFSLKLVINSNRDMSVFWPHFLGIIHYYSTLLITIYMVFFKVEKQKFHAERQLVLDPVLSHQILK